MELIQHIEQLLGNSRVEVLDVPELFGDYEIQVMRDDLIHHEVSGNKLRKLKHNLLQAKRRGKTKLITFGGAYSNHIAAVAAAGKLFDFETIGVIRGDELTASSNQTLKQAFLYGMELQFVTRQAYRGYREPSQLLELELKYPDALLIPEGGNNILGSLGCSEAIGDLDYQFTDLCCAIGTGATFSGYVAGLKEDQFAHGFPVLKENYLKDLISNRLAEMSCKHSRWEIHSSYHFGGYAKITTPLIDFIADFQRLSSTFAEPVYTGKLFYGVHKLCQEKYFRPDAKLLIIHTGGLQGWNGYADLQPFKK